mgnify:CR=1 FL=1
MKTTAEKIAIMQASVEGKTIECEDCGAWFVSPIPKWDWRNYDYRIKRVPLTVWVIEYPDGLLRHYSDKDAAMQSLGDDKWRPQESRSGRLIMMQEVTE